MDRPASSGRLPFPPSILHGLPYPAAHPSEQPSGSSTTSLARATSLQSQSATRDSWRHLFSQWTIEVDALDLLVTLDVFNTTSVANATFDKCKAAKPTSALGRLPGELMDQIKDSLFESVYRSKKLEWQIIMRCGTACAPKAHFTSRESVRFERLSTFHSRVLADRELKKNRVLLVQLEQEMNKLVIVEQRRHNDAVLMTAKRVAEMTSKQQTENFHATYGARPIVCADYYELFTWICETERGNNFALDSGKERSHFSLKGYLAIKPERSPTGLSDLRELPFLYMDDRTIFKALQVEHPRIRPSKAGLKALKATVKVIDEWKKMEAETQPKMKGFKRLPLLDISMSCLKANFDGIFITPPGEIPPPNLYVFGTFTSKGWGSVSGNLMHPIRQFIADLWDSEWWKVYGYDTLEFADDVRTEQARRIGAKALRSVVVSDSARRDRQEDLTRLFLDYDNAEEKGGVFGFKDLEL